MGIKTKTIKMSEECKNRTIGQILTEGSMKTKVKYQVTPLSLLESLETIIPPPSQKLKGVMLSESNEWGTPQWLYDQLNKEFNFTLDAAASITNHKCDKYFTIEDNGLEQDWSNDIVYLNPPYGREVGLWIKKTFNEAVRGATVVCLIAARTDTRFWHDYCMNAAEIRFIKGRLKFTQEGKKNAPAPFPSAVVVFRPYITKLQVSALHQPHHKK